MSLVGPLPPVHKYCSLLSSSPIWATTQVLAQVSSMQQEAKALGSNQGP